MNYDPKHNVHFNFFTAQNNKFLFLEPEPYGAALFCRFRDLERPEPSKKVAAPQHCLTNNDHLIDTGMSRNRLLYKDCH